MDSTRAMTRPFPPAPPFLLARCNFVPTGSGMASSEQAPAPFHGYPAASMYAQQASVRGGRNCNRWRPHRGSRLGPGTVPTDDAKLGQPRCRSQAFKESLRLGEDTGR